MNEFIERLKNDIEFRHELRDYLAGQKDRMNEIVDEYNKQRDKLVVSVIDEFAGEKGIELSDTEEAKQKRYEVCRSVHKREVNEYDSALKMLFS